METWELPELYCPFTEAVNRHAEVVDHNTVRWAEESGLLADPYVRKKLQFVGVGWLAGRTYPTTDLEGLQLITDWCTWLFLQDDQCDERGLGQNPVQLGQVHARSLQILRGATPTPSDPPLTRVLTDFRQRIRAKASHTQFDRFLERVAQTFEASVWESGNRARGIVPALEDYVEQRPFTGGIYTLTELIEVVEHFHLSASVYNHAAMQKLTRHAAAAVCWANDLFSLAKELKQGDVHNIILVLKNRHAISIQEAIHRAAALHDAEVYAFQDLEGRLPDFGAIHENGVKQYTHILKAWMRGNLDWSILSGRYLMAGAQTNASALYRDSTLSPTRHTA